MLTNNLKRPRDAVPYLKQLLEVTMMSASTQENLSSEVANNKGADQPAHMRSLLSAFVICFLESIIWTSLQENLSSGFPTKRDSSQFPQLLRLAIKLKFHL